MKGRLRVLHLAHVRWFNAEAQYAVDLAGEMARQGHRSAVLGLPGSPAVGQAREAGLEVFEEAGFNAKGLGMFRALPAAVRLAGLLGREGFDAAVAHRPEGLPLVALACRWASVPLVRVRGDMRPVRADLLNRLLYRRLLAGVVASNRTIEASLRERLGGVRNLRTIPGGVDPDAFTPKGPAAPVREVLGLPAGAFLVGILGRLGSVKGHDDFLAAAGLARRAGADVAFVVLVKDPTSREEELRACAAADPALAGRVGFLGRRADLPAVLRAFDLGVVASTGSEANCRVGLEWMASGVPLLATRVGVLPDLVVTGETGFLVDPRQPVALAERITELAGRRAVARAMGGAARTRVLARFTLARCAEAYEALLAEASAGRSRGPR